MTLRFPGKNFVTNLILLICWCGLFFEFSCSKNERVENSTGENRTVAFANQNTNPKKSPSGVSPFMQNLPADIASFDRNDEVSTRILNEYGAIFAAQGGVTAPPEIIFKNEADCAEWQSKVQTRRESFGVEIELQTAAMNDLIAARDEIRSKSLNITARGTWAGRRSYRDTEKIWSTRITPGLAFWTQRGKLDQTTAQRIRSLAPAEQIGEILRLESKGMFFSKDFSKSVLYSATPPGASQHLSMLAVDINENGNPTVRLILAKHGWFQTVVSDVPHFTYLGVSEDKLPTLGLKKILKDNRTYWVPDF